jgi:hypothetical protein
MESLILTGWSVFLLSVAAVIRRRWPAKRQPAEAAMPLTASAMQAAPANRHAA